MNKDNEILTDCNDERIEKYLRGAMTEEEETAFKQDIRNNPELRSQAMTMTSLIRGLQAKNGAIEKAVVKENTSKSRVRPVLLWACSVAAVFAIIFGFYREHRYRMLEASVSPYYTEYNMEDISRGDVDSTKVAHLYSLFTQIQDNRSVSGIIKELEPIYQSLDNDFTYHPWANDIAWNLAVAYVKDDQIDNAVNILKKLKEENPDTPIYTKANELIKKLSDL